MPPSGVAAGHVRREGPRQHVAAHEGFVPRPGSFVELQVGSPSQSVARLISAPRGAPRAAAIEKGMKTMFQDGLAKALLGETTLEEVFRVAL